MNLSSTKIKISNFQARVIALTAALFCIFCLALLNMQSANINNGDVLGVVTGKEGYALRYSKTTNGGIVFAGNSLCLAENVDYGSCGTYTSLDSQSVDQDFSPKTNGTVANWEKNGGFTNVNIPDKSQVLYAELIWGGNYKYLDKSIQNNLDNAVKLELPNGKVESIKPVKETAAEVQESHSYVRTSGDISGLIGSSGKGKYSLSGVPSVMIKGNPYNNYVGFTLAIVYYNQDEPARNLSLFTAAEQVGPDQFTNTAEIKGFATPTSGAVNGKLLVSAQEGDSMYNGDRLKFGSNTNNLQDLQGPNNKVDNFFASQINNNDGYLDSTGSFGSKNQALNSNKVGARQGWDVTAVNISNRLTNKQTSAYAKATSTGDTYLINALGIQIEVNSAQPKLSLELVSQTGQCKEDMVNLKITAVNNGRSDSQNNFLLDIAPDGFEVVDKKISINGQSSIFEGNSAKLPNLSYQQTASITYTLKNVGNKTSLNNGPTFSYDYVMMDGAAPISGKIVIPTDKIDLSQNCKANLPPRTEDDSSMGKMNSNQNIEILKNDSDAEETLSYKNVQISLQPKNGTVEIKDGSVIYTPAKDYTGLDTFNYKICDVVKSCDEATVNLTVIDIQAITDSESMNVGEMKTIQVLENDIFKADVYNPKSLEVVKQGVAGQAVVDIEKSTINYKATATAAASDVFEYKICLLNSGFCSIAEVKIGIETIPPLPPVANSDDVTTQESKPVIVEILKNDVAGEGELVASTIQVTKPSENGSVEVNLQSGEIQYSPKSGFSGVDTLAYKVCNQAELCSTTDVKITVQALPIVKSDTQSLPTANILTQPIKAINQALKPIPSVLGVSELVRSGGKNVWVSVAFGVIGVVAAATFVWLSLQPEKKSKKAE